LQEGGNGCDPQPVLKKVVTVARKCLEYTHHQGTSCLVNNINVSRQKLGLGWTFLDIDVS
jgi:hypothetical protein